MKLNPEMRRHLFKKKALLSAKCSLKWWGSIPVWCNRLPTGWKGVSLHSLAYIN